MTDERAPGDDAVTPVPDVQPETRPRPAYGEYATAEEQRARIRQPDATYALETGQSIEPSAPSAAPAWTPPERVVDPAVRAGRRRFDVTAAWVLLGYGLVNVVLTILRLRDYAAVVQESLTLAGITATFTNIAGGQLWATIGSILLALGWLLTALWVLRRGRRGGLVWWIPLVGAAVSFVVLTVCLMVPLMTDPAIVSAITGAR